MKWLIDPLPVNVRVIVSVNVETCPQPWRYVTFLSGFTVAQVRVVSFDDSYWLASKQLVLSRAGGLTG